MASPISTLTPEVQERIVHAVACGAMFETACAFGGVPKMTFRDWLKKGRAGKKPYVALVEELDLALAVSETRALETIHRAMDDDWKAAAWYLERKWPERYGKRWAITPGASDDGQQLTPDQISTMTDEELDQLIEDVAKLAAKRSPVMPVN